MAYKFIKQSDEKGWDKKKNKNEITYDSVVNKICEATKKKLSGKDIYSVLRVSANPDTYILRLFYGVKHIYSCEITLEGANKGQGIKAAKKEARVAINHISESRMSKGSGGVITDEGLHKGVMKAFNDRVAANKKREETNAQKIDKKVKEKVMEPAKPGIPGMAFHKK